jgi:hypothetical protein
MLLHAGCLSRWSLKFDSPLPEDHRVNILSTADSLRHLQTRRRIRLNPRHQCLPKIEVG